LYFRNRWYAPHLGQWLSQDALGAVDSHDLYAFNAFDPVNFVDPWGLEAKGVALFDEGELDAYAPCSVADPTCPAKSRAGAIEPAGPGAGGGERAAEWVAARADARDTAFADARGGGGGAGFGVLGGTRDMVLAQAPAAEFSEGAGRPAAPTLRGRVSLQVEALAARWRALEEKLKTEVGEAVRRAVEPASPRQPTETEQELARQGLYEERKTGEAFADAMGHVAAGAAGVGIIVGKETVVGKGVGRALKALPAVTKAAGGGARALPAARQIEAAWGASTYRHGGLMTGIEHIMYRHSASSGFANVSRFAPGTTARNIVGYVDEALRYGTVTQTGPGAFTVEHALGRTIGTNIAGEAASSIRVLVRDGIIQTAFPF
jgi:hypothetical protein